MDEIQIYVRTAITILGLAYPILLQVVSRLDEKYASNHIVELFDREISKKCFKIILISSLTAVLIWTFKFEPLLELPGVWGYLINNSSALFVLASTILLVVTFFFFVERILIYYTPAKFINYLILKHNKKSSDLRYFNALTDVFLHSVQKQNDNISRTISRFFYDEFKKEREKFTLEPVVYPEAYYALVYRSIEELAIIKNKKNIVLEHRTAGGIWLLGELKGFEISETTYGWLWRNILLAVKYEQDDMILFHWETSHQYFQFNLANILPESDTETHQISNEQTIEKRKLERKRFLEFHYALGGLLLYKERYKCIRRIFRYTTSEPPSYDLLPVGMNEVFNRYIEFREFYMSFISHKYWFPEQEGIHSDGVIVRWISAYIAVLFLRQYTIIPYWITIQPLVFPTSPIGQGEKRKWIDSLDFFKKLVSEALENTSLINALNFDFISEEWCSDNEKIYPLDFIDQLKQSLIEEYDRGSLTLTISAEKKNKFYTSTTRILEETYLIYSSINNNSMINEDYNDWFVNGKNMVQSKDAFAEQSEIDHMDYDSFPASVVSGNIKEGIASTFMYNKTKSYLIKPEEIFTAIDRLGIDENYLIISFGLYIPYYTDSLRIQGLTTDSYKGTRLASIPHSQEVYQSLFVLKKVDLPIIVFDKVKTEKIERYALDKISEKHNIYASVLDLNEVSQTIKAESSLGKTEDELSRSVLLCIAQSTRIRWKKNIELVQIIAYSEYRQQGLPNLITDVQH